MPFKDLVFSSAGSFSVAVVAAFIFILQIWFSAKRSEFRWCRWAAAGSFSTILYAVGILIEYNAPEGPINRFGGLLEWTAVIFLVHALYGFVFSRLNMPSRRYHLAAGGLHVLILILLWSTNIFVSEHFVSRPFLTLEKPFVEADLGPLGPVFILYALGASINAIRLWIVKEKEMEPRSRAFVWGVSFWILLGAHDAAAAVGLPTVQYVMEYGFLGFSAALLYTMFSDRVRTLDALELSNVALRKEMETRKRVVEGLKENEDKFRTLFEMESDAVFLIDDETKRIMEANEAALRLYGYSREELLSSKILDLSAEPEKTLKGIRQRETHIPLRWHLRKNGSRFPAEITRSLFKWQGREVHISAVRDISSRLESETKLLETQAFLMSILDNAPALIYINTRDNRYRLVNKAWERFTGKTNEEVQGLRIEEIFSAGTAREFMTVNQKIMETGLPVAADEAVAGPERKVFFHTVKFPLMDAAGRIDSVCGISVDITERKRAVDTLREKSLQAQRLADELELIIDGIPGLVFFKDTENRFVRVNKFVADAHQMTKKQLEGTSCFELYSRELAQAYFEDDLEVIQSRKPKLNIDEQWETEYGTRWVNTTKIPYLNEKGEVTGVIGLSLDITERKKAEEALQRSETLHKQAQSVAQIGHWELDPDIGTPIWSDEIFRIFGLDPDEGEPSFTEHETHVHPEDWPILDKAVRKAGMDGTPFDLVFRILKSDGEIGWMHAIGTTSMDDEGNVTNLFGTAQDITALRLTEDALRESE
jgi:PAS domain S-box-containing protein